MIRFKRKHKQAHTSAQSATVHAPFCSRFPSLLCVWASAPPPPGKKTHKPTVHWQAKERHRVQTLLSCHCLTIDAQWCPERNKNRSLWWVVNYDREALAFVCIHKFFACFCISWITWQTLNRQGSVRWIWLLEATEQNISVTWSGRGRPQCVST